MTYADTRTVRPDDGVVNSSGGPRADQPRRRVFTPEFKLAMVAEYDRAAPGERGALLRRERLYHSHIIEWRKARDAGTLLAPPAVESAVAGSAEPRSVGSSSRRRRGVGTAEQAELERLRRQNEKLARDLARNQAALEIMGKAHALLELLSESTDPKHGPGSSR